MLFRLAIHLRCVRKTKNLFSFGGVTLINCDEVVPPCCADRHRKSHRLSLGIAVSGHGHGDSAPSRSSTRGRCADLRVRQRSRSNAPFSRSFSVHCASPPPHRIYGAIRWRSIEYAWQVTTRTTPFYSRSIRRRTVVVNIIVFVAAMGQGDLP